MIEDIIYKKLMTPKSEKAPFVQKTTIFQDKDSVSQQKMSEVILANIAENEYVEQCFGDLERYIHVMENTRQNYAFRHIYSCRKVIGKVIVFGKRVVRKFLKWYIEPICFQQTEFNNAVTPSIGRLTEITRELSLQDRIHQRQLLDSNRRMDEVIAASASQIAAINQRMERMESNQQSLQTLTAESVAMVNRRMDQAEAGQQALQASSVENFAAAMRYIGQLEEHQNTMYEGMSENYRVVTEHQQKLQEEHSRTEEQIQKLQQEVQAGVGTTDTVNQKLTDQIVGLAQELNELRSMLNLKTAAIQNLESDINCVREANPMLFNEVQPSLFDKRTTSQSGEDSIVFYITMMLGMKPEEVTYLDLGANHAKEMSNTFYFYQRGACGVLVEANPELIPELKLLRHRDIILNRCVSATDGEQIEFFVVNGDGVSSYSKDTVDRIVELNPILKVVKTVKVETISANSIMERYFNGAPTLLNIDIEGSDMDVLRALDFSKYRPLVIVAETIPYAPQLVVGPKNTELVEFMKEKNYAEYAFTGINSIFVDKTQLEGRAFM